MHGLQQKFWPYQEQNLHRKVNCKIMKTSLLFQLPLGPHREVLSALTQPPALTPSDGAASAGNQTQALPQCNDSVSNPAVSAVSEERAANCSGKGPLGPEGPVGACEMPIGLTLSPQTADSCAWQTGTSAAPGEWRSCTRAPGAPSVMTTGA